MAPLTPAERQKLLLQQEIAKLSGAISRHSTSSTSSSYHPYRGRGFARGYAPPRGRGRGRGGRGGSYALDLRQTNKQSSSAEPSRPSSSASAYPTSQVEEKEAGEVDPSPPASDPPVAGPSGTSSTWVKGKGKSGNMSLMTAERSAQLKTQRQTKPRIPPQIQIINSLATASGDKRVVIDGVVFQFEQDGKKLTRIGEAPSSAGHHTPTRKSLSFGGEKYRRTSRGNLILKRNGSTSKSNQLCRYFTKTGRCNFGLTCPHIHDPTKVTICSRYLRGTCTLGNSCPLSHTPSTHNTPSCVRFQSTSNCSKPNCPYPHVKVSSDAPVCEDFAKIGWCDKEPGTCEELHVWECQEFREKGTCSKNGKCGLRHVVRAEVNRPVEPSDERPRHGEGGFEEQDSFIEFDQGSPGLISDEDGEEAEEGDSGSGIESEESDSEDASDSSDDDDNGKRAIPSSPSAHPPSDMMDTDEVDEDAVLDVVF
ncbi:hypothetical protein I302_108368 [Kwoniella bestiolae CBS 10118]|uniref:C3H1-type domain-containing protein n=1 Tax=Kwoniella bestiolae CBS 10118 TaxID=1296100 RepID=A0A1B9FVW0_9TREE|nr:hypothetical protein I302_07259 [Kwoniella bestiolae CBS 10118]OCF22909.1 hypothetical protein I302_07259 [Kwoniella bestiolae CBS 10118]